jgi:agmatine/peptidylarginine deiminase
MATRHFLPEWRPQQAVLLTWPHGNSDWRPWLGQADKTYASMTEAISLYETCIILAYDADHELHIRQQLLASKTRSEQVRFIQLKTNDTWIRDYGPLTVREDDNWLLIDFAFNGWGGKYEAELDDAVTRHLHEQQLFGPIPLARANMIMEGGSLETDGHDTILTTSQCLLHPGRNPGMDRQQLEQAMHEHLGAERILWLDHGELQGDDTDGHVDTLARFCSPDTIAYVACSDDGDSHFSSLQAMAKQLQAFRDHQGQPYNLVPLPLPAAITDEQGNRLPATYANFLIINNAVIVPVYEVAEDDAALRQLELCFPGRTLLPVPARVLVHQYGSVHCATMQLPAGVVA